MNTEKRTKKPWLGRFILFALALVLTLSTLVAVGGCSDEGDASSSASPSASPTPKPQSVGNGNFDLLYDNSDNSDYPRTPKEWSYSIDGSGSNKAPDTSSDLLHGIINVQSDKFDPNVTADSSDKKKFGELTNPLAPKFDPDAEQDPDSDNYVEDTDKGNILMLYNKNDTAIRYKSPSITVPVNSYLKLSVWVKTAGLDPDTNDTIAHINITGGVEDPVYVKNINTNGVTDNNGYVQYTFYVEGSAFSSKTVYLELGLGYGDKLHQIEHAAGYAFFDDIELKHLSQREYYAELAEKQLTENNGSNNQVYRVNGDVTERIIVDAQNIASPNLAYSFVKKTAAKDDFSKMTAVDGYSKTFPFDGTKTNSEVKYATDKSNDVDGVLANNFPFTDGTGVLLLNNTDRTALAYRQPVATHLSPYKYYRISFWVKTSEFKNSAGLSIVLSNGVVYNYDPARPQDPVYESLSSFTGVDTTKSDKDLEDEDVTKEYKWENWQQYSFLVQSDVFDEENDIGLEFYLGPQFKDPTDATFDWKLTKGYAFITQPVVEELTKSEYSSASTGDTSKKVTLGISNSPSVANGGFGTPTNAFGDFSFDNGLLAPMDWRGYEHGLSNVGGDGVNLAPNTGKDVHGGITNHLLLANGTYDTNGALPKGNPTALVIQSLAKATAFGYASNNLTMSANSYYVVDVNVMADANTKFGIYLVDKENPKRLLGSDGYKDTGEKDEDNEPIYEKDPDYDTLKFTGTGAGTANDGSKWVSYRFFFKTQDEAKNFRIELWLGNREFNTDTPEDQSAAYTSGAVYFDDIRLTSINETQFKAATAGTNVIKQDYTKADTKPEASASPSPSPSEEESTKEPFNWAVLATGIATLLMVAALAVVGVKKFLLDPKRKGKKKRKDKETKNTYDKAKKHYGSASSGVSEEESDEDEAEEETETAEQPESETEKPAEDDDDLDIGTEQIDALLDEEDEDESGDDKDKLD